MIPFIRKFDQVLLQDRRNKTYGKLLQRSKKATCIKYFTFICAAILLTSCGIPDRSEIQGTFDGESFTLTGRVGSLSRHGERMDCSQSISFYPAYPVGDQLRFSFGFKGKDMYQGFKDQVNKNLLFNQKDRIDNFYILGYTDKEIEIDIGDAPEGDFFIIQNVELMKKRFRKSPFKELNEVVVIKGKMKIHFDEIIIESNYEFAFGQCYE